jgi:polyene macrolide polyketide synthase
MLQPDKESARASPPRAGTVYRAVYEAEDGLLADHVITGRSILPGASMVDLALAAAQARQLPCLALKDVLICRPGVARERLEVEVKWGNSSGFTIHDGRNLLCIGRSEEREVVPKANVLVFDVTARGDPVEPRALYADLDRLGYRYGPGLQVIRSALKVADGMLFKLSAENHRDCRSESMNPALLDGAIQAVFCMMQYSPRPIRPGGLLVPTGFRRLSIHGSVQGTCFVQVVELALARRADDVIADLQIRNERGRPLLRIEGLLLKYVPRDFLDKFDERVPAKPS